jgi:hypothetical protein
LGEISSSKKDLDHELFFGLVFSLALMFISYPSISDMTVFFKMFTTENNSIFTANVIKLSLISLFIISSLCRYYGAIKEKQNYIIRSVAFFILSLIWLLHIIVYNIFYNWLIQINIYFIIAIPALLYFILSHFLCGYEKTWYSFYGDFKSKILITELFLLFNAFIIFFLLYELCSTIIFEHSFGIYLSMALSLITLIIIIVIGLKYKNIFKNQNKENKKIATILLSFLSTASYFIPYYLFIYFIMQEIKISR